MNDDLVSFKMLVVSEAASDRDVLRRAVAEAAFSIDYAEVADPGDAAAICKLVAQDGLDFVFVDSKIPKADRQAMYDVAQSLSGRPLVIFVGPAILKTREVMSDGVAADGVLAKPLDVTEAVAIIGVCVRARLTKQVLVVDDSATTRSIIRKLLQASRFHLRVTEAEDGASAIELASKQRFDVVFLDCYMPGRDGFATLETLKRDHADIQVVMITGTKDYRIEDRARAGGAKEFLFKPFFAKGIDGILYRLFGLIGPKTI